MKAGGGSVTATVLGATRAFPSVRRFRLGAGRFFDAEEEAGARRVAVLGARVAERLFADEPADALIGRDLRLRGIPFEIVGVLEAKGVLADGSDEDNTIVIPIRTALRRVFNVAYLSTVFVTVRESNRRSRMDAAQARSARSCANATGCGETPRRTTSPSRTRPSSWPRSGRRWAPSHSSSPGSRRSPCSSAARGSSPSCSSR